MGFATRPSKQAILMAALASVGMYGGAGESANYHPPGKLKGTPPNPNRKNKAQRKAEKRAKQRATNQEG